MLISVLESADVRVYTISYRDGLASYSLRSLATAGMSSFANYPCET